MSEDEIILKEIEQLQKKIKEFEENREKERQEIKKILRKGMEECERYYPKSSRTVAALSWEYMKHTILSNDECIHDKKRYMRFHKYLWAFSDYVAKRYFPNEINEDWRRPCALEDGITNLMIKHLTTGMREIPGFKEDLIQNLQTDPKLKDNPMVPLMESLIAGVPIRSDEFAEALDIPKTSMNKQVDKMIKTKQLKINEDYYFI